MEAVEVSVLLHTLFNKDSYLNCCLNFSWDRTVSFRVPGVMLCSGSRRKKNIDNTLMVIVAALRCCTEQRLCSARGLRCW